MYKRQSEAWNFGPNDEDCKSVGYVLNKLFQIWGCERNVEQCKSINPHEAQFLKLDCSKAHSKLRWTPKWNLSRALEMTASWHKSWLNNDNMLIKTQEQIDKYNS